VFRQWPASKHPVARRQRLEVLIGFTGFFAVIAFVSAVVAELRGESAIMEVVVLAFFVAVLGFTIRSWRRIGP
jgi:ABC-type transport system involved in cytochrome c biogenesis permease component